jgi:heptosyltransferase-2
MIAMPTPTQPTRIVVRAPNWVGDAVMAIPFLASLRLNAPNAAIHLVCRAALADLWEDLRLADRVIALDEQAGRSGLRSVWRNARRLRPERYDLGFCLPPSFGSALMFRLAGVRRRVGHAADARGWLLSDRLPYGADGRRPHRAEGYLQLLQLVWPEAQTDRNLHYRPGPQAVAVADTLLSSIMPPLGAPMAIAPGAAQPNKLWPAARFAEIGRRWQAIGGQCWLVGGQNDCGACEAVAAGLSTSATHNLCGRGTLPVVGEIIRRAALFVGNDSGLSHLAAAVGTPVVVISGPGDPTEVAPFTVHALTVKKSLFCSPCYSNRCFRKDYPLECQDLVTAEDVWSAVRRLSGRA